MGKTQSFKEQFSFEERVQESQDMIAKYPDRVPVVAERDSKSDLPEMEKRKYLVICRLANLSTSWVLGFGLLLGKLSLYSSRIYYLKQRA